MNAHTKLKLHLERYVYKRGRNKGEAPADSSRRAKTHFRVIKGNGGQMIVRFHNADILTAYEDGHIKLDAHGWHASPTTRSAMNEALYFFGMGTISSVRKGGYSQTGIHIGRKTYRYYDNMEFAADGTPLTPLKQFTAKITDREETAEFRADIRDSGFVGMFPILYAAAGVPDTQCVSVWFFWVPRIKDAICSEYGANEWPDIIALAKYPTYYHRNSAQPAHKDHKAALKAFIASHTRTMTKLVDLDETVL
jgi:hypothetical protein